MERAADNADPAAPCEKGIRLSSTPEATILRTSSIARGTPLVVDPDGPRDQLLLVDPRPRRRGYPGEDVAGEEGLREALRTARVAPDAGDSGR